MFDCTNPSTLTYAYWNMLPLVRIDPSNNSLSSTNSSGVMVEALRHLTKHCCAEGTRLEAAKEAMNPRDLEDSSTETFVLPVRKSLMRLQTYYPYNEQFIPVLESPGNSSYQYSSIK